MPMHANREQHRGGCAAELRVSVRVDAVGRPEGGWKRKRLPMSPEATGAAAAACVDNNTITDEKPSADCDEWSRCEKGESRACFCTCRGLTPANAIILVPLPE
jgi:hypothetical protein